VLQNEDSVWLKVFPSYYWQLTLGPIFGIMGIFIFLFLWFQLDDTTSRLLTVAALGCLAIAVGMDFIEGLDRGHRWNVYTWISNDFDVETWKKARHFNELEAWTQKRFGESAYDTLRHFSKSIEETLEMFANSIFWFMFLRHLPVAVGDLRVEFKP
jgi:hypothetical protein